MGVVTAAVPEWAGRRKGHHSGGAVKRAKAAPADRRWPLLGIPDH